MLSALVSKSDNKRRKNPYPTSRCLLQISQLDDKKKRCDTRCELSHRLFKIEAATRLKRPTVATYIISSVQHSIGYCLTSPICIMLFLKCHNDANLRPPRCKVEC